MKRKIILATAAATLLAAPSAFAQDSSPFAGPYVGVQIGASQIESKHSDLDGWYWDARNSSQKDTGVQVGLKAGYDYASGPLLAGILAEAQFGKVNSYAEYMPEDPSYEVGTKVTSLGSVRAKLGLTSGKLAAFATGGFAFSNAKYNYNETDTSNEYSNGKGDRSGYVIGAGLAYAVSPKSSIGVDVSRYNFGSRNFFLNREDGTVMDDYRWKIKDRIESVTISYNLHF
ncbi:MAG TPA: outer membrane beta-barrel protein [Sphingopyxis sp.]|nr:outer membrane beta-barrel protein [Sphingopyxis sp.]